MAEARRALATDKQIALDTLTQTDNATLNGHRVAAPWDPEPRPLGFRLLTIVEHLVQHKGQLFYYLKLQGKPVNTSNLWGM